MWHNLGEYAEKAVAAHRGCLSGAAPVPGTADTDGVPGGDAPPAPLPEEPDGLRDVLGRERVLVARTLERHAAVRELLGEGRSRREAADILGLDRKTVNRFAAEADPARVLVKATGRARKLDPLIPGSTSAGTKASPTPQPCTARSPRRAGPAASRPSSATPPVPRRRRPQQGRPQSPPGSARRPASQTREVTRWLLTRPDNLDPADQARLDAATAQCPHLGILAACVRSFAKIMTLRQGEAELEGWLTTAEASGLPQLRSFARGIRRDQQAVTAGISLPYSSAALEGNVHKIKLIKRQSYGRAGFPLLRKRVIHHPA